MTIWYICMMCVIDHVYMCGRSNDNTNFRFKHIAQIKIQLNMYQTRMEVQHKLKKYKYG
jgi:hypothetical protein